MSTAQRHRARPEIALLASLALAPALGALAQPPVHGLIVMPATADKGRVSTAAVRSYSTTLGQPVRVARRLAGEASLLRLETGLAPDAAQAAAARLAARADVAWASPDYWRRPSAVPNDPRFAEQWYLQATTAEPGAANLPAAWDLTTGSAAVVVAVLDTGILAGHADLGRLLPGYDFVSTGVLENDPDAGPDADPSDPGDGVVDGECGPGESALPSSWHGTLVSGIIGATTDNSLGIAGIDRQARLLPIRVLGKCGGLDSDILDAARWAVGLPVPNVPDNPNPAQVLNLSFGGPGGCTAAYQAAFTEVLQRGVLVVAAAGNGGGDAATISPASCTDAITVAATTRQGAETLYTNVGAVVDLAAPGGHASTVAAGILSTGDSGTAGPHDDSSYHAVTGTSFSAPVVSGVISLALSLGTSLTPAQIEIALRATARPFPSGTSDGFGDCDNTRCGAGLVDAAALLQAVRDGQVPGLWLDGRKVEVLGDNSARGGLGALQPPLLLALTAIVLLRRRWR